MLVRFWGVRGSVPWSRPDACAHGCNTACLEVRDEARGALLILDAGTGLVGLSDALGDEPREITIVLSHYHWDHIQGLPFFAPFFKPGWRVCIYAPRLGGAGARDVESIFDPPFFPVGSRALVSPPEVRLYGAEAFDAGGFHLRTAALNHPGGAFACRVEGSAADLVYASDHEFGNAAVDEPLAALALNSGASVLSAHFTPEELPSFVGWGHSSWRQSTEFASATGAGHLWLFHHRPGRTDTELADIEGRARRVYPAARAAREGDFFRL